MNQLPENSYRNILASLKEKIRLSRYRASLKVNFELLKIYWEIGNAVLLQQKEEGWGAKVIDNLALDLKLEFPDFKGLSVRNIKYMRAFAEAYPDFLIVQPVAAQLTGNEEITQNEKVQPVVALIPWTHHIPTTN